MLPPGAAFWESKACGSLWEAGRLSLARLCPLGALQREGSALRLDAHSSLIDRIQSTVGMRKTGENNFFLLELNPM